MADSNVLMPRDYIQRLLARWEHNTGVVCSVPIASRPTNFWAELECAFLNTYEARWEYAADSLGIAFAQGKSMLTRKSVIERGGGIRALGAEIAEDAALTKLLKAAGLKVHLVNNPFEQPLGARSAAEVWSRQTRWSRLRRMTFPLMFLPELLPGAFFPFSAAMGFAVHVQSGTAETAGLAMAFLLLWFGAEAALARIAGWPWSIGIACGCVLRDVLLPLLWVDAWFGSSFTWRGTEMRPREAIEASR
jgi:ceramide glucosyltransferase